MTVDVCTPGSVVIGSERSPYVGRIRPKAEGRNPTFVHSDAKRHQLYMACDASHRIKPSLDGASLVQAMLARLCDLSFAVCSLFTLVAAKRNKSFAHRVIKGVKSILRCFQCGIKGYRNFLFGIIRTK